MKYPVLFLVLLLLITAAGAVTNTFTFHFNGQCPPDNKVTLKCFDLTGELAISSSIQICEHRTFQVDSRFKNLICVVICNGTVVYKKRFDLPGATWRAVQGYPWDISRLNDTPNNTPITAITDVVIRSAGDCGNGQIDPGERCDTGGNKGCPDPKKPACYECLYCGCNDPSQCVAVSGLMSCGAYGCKAYERPRFGRECVLGVCVNPVKCQLDPECIEKYQASREDNLTPTSRIRPVTGDRAYTDPLIHRAVFYNRFGEDSSDVLVGGDILNDTPSTDELLDLLYCVDGCENLPDAEEIPACDPLIIARLMGADIGSVGEEDTIDPALAALIGTARMNIFVGTCPSHLITDGGRVVGMGEGKLSDNTLTVRTDKATTDAMERGELSFLEAYDEGRIRIDGEGFVEGLKFAIAEFLYRLSGLFR